MPSIQVLSSNNKSHLPNYEENLILWETLQVLLPAASFIRQNIHITSWILSPGPLWYKCEILTNQGDKTYKEQTTETCDGEGNHPF